MKGEGNQTRACDHEGRGRGVESDSSREEASHHRYGAAMPDLSNDRCSVASQRKHDNAHAGQKQRIHDFPRTMRDLLHEREREQDSHPLGLLQGFSGSTEPGERGGATRAGQAWSPYVYMERITHAVEAP